MVHAKVRQLMQWRAPRWIQGAVLAASLLAVQPNPLAAAPATQGAHDEGEIAPGAPAAWDTVDDSPAQTPSGMQPSAAAAPSDCLGATARNIRYTSDGVIHLEGCGQTFTLSQIAADPDAGPDRLQLVDAANKIWLLKIKLKVEEGATLKVIGGASGDANWLRLRSDAADAVWLRAENGNILFQSTKVTSWDTTSNAVDTDAGVAANGSGGRAYIATRSVLTKGRATAAPTACSTAGGSQEPYEGRMDVVNSQISYLGYNAAESYGIIWKVYYKPDATDPSDQPPPGRQLYAMVDVFGNATGSTFDHNYFGSYIYGGYCMNWNNNTFANNIQYGLDPHDDSDFLTITGNVFHDNGNHGVICSVECNDLVISNNTSYRNEHGIMVHRNSNGARVENNTVYDNRGAGIAIFDSHDAIIRNNTVTNNGESAVRLSVGSSRNLVESNTLTGLSSAGTGSGYVIYTYKGSDPPTAGDGMPKQNTFRNNTLTGYKTPLLKIGDAPNNVFEANTIAGPSKTFAFTNATGNIIRNSPIGTTFPVTLDATSSVTLQDTRNNVWLLAPNGLSTIATTSQSSLNLTFANTGGSITVTTLDLTVRPASGSLWVLPATWQANSKSWNESGSAGGAVAHSVGGLQSGSCYTVTANDKTLTQVQATSAGRIAFDYAGGYANPVTFGVGKASACSAPAPSYRIVLPLIRR
ncbi:MAG TPA: right-handed parallel beta-helix repeat-containing protein [Roseiflexaceae bacterium]|nr:right-handed parallel beta-helix repeat-containing protein [Roseiflexaceae bacterium]